MCRYHRILEHGRYTVVTSGSEGGVLSSEYIMVLTSGLKTLADHW